MKKVTVYSTPTCPWCHKVKDWLAKQKVKFTDINVSTDDKARNAMITKSGQKGVPVIEIGNTIIVGFNESAIQKALS